MTPSCRIKSAFFTNDQQMFRGQPGCAIATVYSQGRRERVAELTDLYPQIIGDENFEEHASDLADVEVIFSTWTVTPRSAEKLSGLPNLKAIFYAAGATNSFREPFQERGITVCSSSPANAVPVAEFCLGQILLSTKGFFQNSQGCLSRSTMAAFPFVGRGAYGARVTLIGNGAISRKLQELLKPFALDVQVIPSRSLGDRALLEDAFESSYIVSNHLPDLDSNVGILNGDLFRRMPQGASFLNTGRGRQVNEAEMAAVLRERPDLTALLDVQCQEPPAEDSPLFALPNIYMTSHIAGTYGDEFARVADYMIDEFVRWQRGEPLLYQVTEDML